MTTALFGLFLALCGNSLVAAMLAFTLQALLALASNAKHAVLGEPLLFSDLALVGAIFRHPQFYLSAIRPWQRVAVGMATMALLTVIAWLSVADLLAHVLGLALLIGSLTILALSLHVAPLRRLASMPDTHADLHRHGLLPTLLLYWLRWREDPDPPPCPKMERHTPECAPELLILIQCESFADPADLFDDATLALPGLSFARENAWQWGRLEVSGFGAYTMRTEYGVIFGREEEALGFRRYDPFLTATGEASYALPRQFRGWRSLFVHPHDMRFYGRNRIMPAAGFSELVGEDSFTPPTPAEGRYVTDAAIAQRIMALAETAVQPSLIYAVTIENHGPWASDGSPNADPVAGYLRLVHNSDAMLSMLIGRLRTLGRPAMLVFFGDHRPSIPGATAPGEGRHTPYVMIRIDAGGRIARGEKNRIDLTPAQLHHAILRTVLGEPATAPEA
ncbi:LTA synthase family protein [Sphingomonas colocasiae]|nr:LTA synthase family protein [Sphingomonas colocasiae]